MKINHLLKKHLGVLFIAAISTFGCNKDSFKDASDSAQSPNSALERGDNSGAVVTELPNGAFTYSYPLERSGEPSGGEAGAFCCQMNWVGFQPLPFPPFSTAMTFAEKRFTVPGAVEYRKRIILYRNDVLLLDWLHWDLAGTCEDYGFGIVYPFGECPGVIHITVTKEYRIGNTWYTCTAAHGQFDYLLPSNYLCE